MFFSNSQLCFFAFVFFKIFFCEDNSINVDHFFFSNFQLDIYHFSIQFNWTFNDHIRFKYSIHPLDKTPWLKVLEKKISSTKNETDKKFFFRGRFVFFQMAEELFIKLSASSGLPVDQLKFVIGLLLNVLVATQFHRIPTANAKHVVSIVWSLAWFIFSFGMLFEFACFFAFQLCLAFLCFFFFCCFFLFVVAISIEYFLFNFNLFKWKLIWL